MTPRKKPRQARRHWSLLAAPLVLVLTGCSKPNAAPVSLVADPPPTEDGQPPGAQQTALDRGVAYIEAGAWEEALPHFETVLANDDKNAKAHYYRAVALKNLNRLDDAKAGLSRALELDSTILEAKIHLGELLLIQEPPEPEKAIVLLEPAVKAEPKAKDTRELLAYAHFLLAHWSESADHYAVLVDLEDNKKFRYQLADTLFRAGRMDESVVQMRKVLPLFSDEVKVVVQLANRFGKAKAFSDCVSGFDIAIGLEPSNAALYVHRGVCKHELKDEKAARLDYAKAVETNDKFQPAYFYLGKSWLHEQRRQKAVDSFKKCIALDPESKMGQRAQAELDRMKKEAKR